MTVAKVKGLSSSLLCSSIRSTRLRELSFSSRARETAVELGRGERPLGMLLDGLSYKCSAETCPGRLQTCFCNAEPRILASQGAHLSSTSLLSRSFFSFLPRVDVLLDDGRPCTIESFRFYGTAIVGVIHVEIRYVHYAVKEKRLKSTLSIQFVNLISIEKL